MIWLTSFYLVFHSALNLSGELLRFADREFYYGWWNANNILEFWKTWNVPVHRFCVRHIFKPMLRAGYSVSSAQGYKRFLSLDLMVRCCRMNAGWFNRPHIYEFVPL